MMKLVKMQKGQEGFIGIKYGAHDLYLRDKAYQGQKRHKPFKSLLGLKDCQTSRNGQSFLDVIPAAGQRMKAEYVWTGGQKAVTQH